MYLMAVSQEQSHKTYKILRHGKHRINRRGMLKSFIGIVNNILIDMKKSLSTMS